MIQYVILLESYLEVDTMLLPGDSTHQASLEVLAKSSTAIHRMSPSIKQR